MDRDIWECVLRATRSLRSAGPAPRRPLRYPDRLILRLYVWLVWHDLPLCRVADRGVYGSLFRPRDLPSVSQFCKRLREPRFTAQLELVRRRLTGVLDHADLLLIDGKALPVTDNTRDADAETGHGGGRFRCGSRLHAMGDDRGRIGEYRVTSMREQEKNMAFEMFARLRPGQLVLGDGNYDSSRLYDAAAARGARLLTKLKVFGKARRTLDRTSPYRREVGELWEHEPDMIADLYARRAAIERTFANLSNHAGGLGRLPPWVRTLRRVRGWVAAKLILYQARRLCRHPSAAP